MLFPPRAEFRYFLNVFRLAVRKLAFLSHDLIGSIYFAHAHFLPKGHAPTNDCFVCGVFVDLLTTVHNESVWINLEFQTLLLGLVCI